VAAPGIYERPDGHMHATALARELAQMRKELASAMESWEAAVAAADALDGG
jgi:hypothetical protein